MRKEWKPRPRYKWAKPLWEQIDGGKRRVVSLGDLETMYSVYCYWEAEKKKYMSGNPDYAGATFEDIQTECPLLRQILMREEWTHTEYRDALRGFRIATYTELHIKFEEGIISQECLDRTVNETDARIVEMEGAVRGSSWVRKILNPDVPDLCI